MRVFVTGAIGFVGSAVVSELLEAGHQVVGLARSNTAVATLTAAGAAVHLGALDDLDSLRRGAATADGVIHLAFMHDFSDDAGAGAADLRDVVTIGAALEGSDKPLVVTSSTLTLAFEELRRVGTEADVPGSAVPQVASENAAIALAERGVRSSVIRLAPSVHGPGDYGVVPRLIDIARDTGVSAVVEYGDNRWPAVHRLDAAGLIRLALEAAPAGSRLHGVGDEGVPFRHIAGVIARQLNVPVLSISREEADIHFGFLSASASADNPTSNMRTRELLGWRPVHPALIPDLDEGHYFRGLVAATAQREARTG